LGMATPGSIYLGCDGGDHASSGRKVALRFAEIAMLALPFAVFVVWRLMAPTAGPPRVLVIAVTLTTGAMAAKSNAQSRMEGRIGRV